MSIPKEIISVTLGPSNEDFVFESTYLDQPVRVHRLGVDGDLGRVRDILQEWDDKAAAFAVGSLLEPYVLGDSAAKEEQKRRIDELCEGLTTPVVSGTGLRRMGEEWSIRHLQYKFGDNYFNNTKALFLSGRTNIALAGTISEYTENLLFADPLLEHDCPAFLKSVPALWAYADSIRGQFYRFPGHWAGNILPPLRAANRKRLRRAVRSAFIVIIPDSGFYRYLKGVGSDELNEKIVITSAATEDRVQHLANRGVDTIIDTTPQILDRVVDANTLEAVLLATVGGEDGVLTQDDLLEIASTQGLVPRVIYPSGTPKRKNRFAFVVHPLAQEHLKRDKIVAALDKYMPKGFIDMVEKAIAYAPPWVYSKFTGVVSPTGVETEGWLITVGGTPKQMLAHSPEFTYKRLLKAAKMAKKMGAQIMGLGAFTKVVGDAGVTVAKLADIPITTGNSYSASGALWAGADAARRMGLLEIESGKRLKAKVMVVGATGAIGSVCCRLLAYAFEEIYMVATRDAKLLALRESVLEDCPDVTVHVTTRADKYLGDMDCIVTATSGAGKKILDIMKVKPGCIITDVARPLDLPPEEVAKRPDVLVIESGEIKVPGNPKYGDIGLPKDVVYACLAETIVLALEGRFEVYTIGRNIEWEKVREIYQMGLKHGMELAAISGINGVYTDEDIARVRELAIAERKKRGMPIPGAAADPPADPSTPQSKSA